ncbi:hypothetical protein ES703_86858 [subsurface metagenome]
MTITCFGPVFIGLKMGFPILISETLIRAQIDADYQAPKYLEKISADICALINVSEILQLIEIRWIF